MRESEIQTKIRLAIGGISRVLVQRRNVGKFIACGGGNIQDAASILRRHGFAASVIKIGCTGEADLQGIVGGQFCLCGLPAHPMPFALEVKTADGKLSPDQCNWRDNTWARRGGLYAVVRGANDALNALNLQGKQ